MEINILNIQKQKPVRGHNGRETLFTMKTKKIEYLQINLTKIIGRKL